MWLVEWHLSFGFFCFCVSIRNLLLLRSARSMSTRKFYATKVNAVSIACIPTPTQQCLCPVCIKQFLLRSKGAWPRFAITVMDGAKERC